MATRRRRRLRSVRSCASLGSQLCSCLGSQACSEWIGGVGLNCFQVPPPSLSQGVGRERSKALVVFGDLFYPVPLLSLAEADNILGEGSDSSILSRARPPPLPGHGVRRVEPGRGDK